MKVRHGFVTNSSSSSFVIMTKAPITKDLLLGHFGLEKDSPFYPFAKEIADVMAGKAKLMTKENFKKEYDWKVERIGEEVVDRYDYFYHGTAWNDAESTEVALCEMDFHLDTPEVFISKEGGY